jgi:hypothetical protein
MHLALETASARVPTASFRNIRFTCDFTVSGETASARAIRSLRKARAIRTLPAASLGGSCSRVGWGHDD